MTSASGTMVASATGCRSLSGSYVEPLDPVLVDRDFGRLTDQQGVTIGGGGNDALGADRSAGAGAVLHHHGLPERSRESGPRSVARRCRRCRRPHRRRRDARCGSETSAHGSRRNGGKAAVSMRQRRAWIAPAKALALEIPCWSHCLRNTGVSFSRKCSMARLLMLHHSSCQMSFAARGGGQAIAVQIGAVHVEPDLGALDIRVETLHHPPEARRVIELDRGATSCAAR